MDTLYIDTRGIFAETAVAAAAVSLCMRMSSGLGDPTRGGGPHPATPRLVFWNLLMHTPNILMAQPLTAVVYIHM